MAQGTTSCGRGTAAIDLTHLRGCLVEWEDVFDVFLSDFGQKMRMF